MAVITCPFCGYVGRPRKRAVGSLLVKMMLLGLSLLGLLFFLFPGLIILAIFLVYCFRSERSCRKCKLALGR